jgi:hypothetical protein
MKMKSISKKLSMLLVAMLAMASTWGQYDRAYALQVGKYSEYTKKWNWEQAQDINLRFTMEGNFLKINDEAGTKLWTYEDQGEKSGVDADGDRYKRHTWKAFDEKNRKCMFIMTWYNEPRLVVYSIIYSDFAFRYYISTETEL